MINRIQIKDTLVIPSWVLPISYFIIIVMLVISLGIFFVVSSECLKGETIMVYKNKHKEYKYYGEVFLSSDSKIRVNDTVIVKFQTANKKKYFARVTKTHNDPTTGKIHTILEFHNNDMCIIGSRCVERIEKGDIIYLTNNFLNGLISTCVR